MIDDINYFTIANQISMLKRDPQWQFKSLIMVEGNLDNDFYKEFFDPTTSQIIIANGKINAIFALYELEKRGENGVLSIVDQDFDLYLNFNYHSENVLCTEYHDIEHYLIHSQAFDKVISVFSNGRILRQIETNFGLSVREIILEIGHKVGMLRLNSILNDWRLNQEKINVYEWLDSNLDLDLDGLLDALILRSPNCTTNIEIIKNKGFEEPNSINLPKYVCKGHDLILVLLFVLKKSIGQMRKVKKLGQQNLLDNLILAYQKSEFESTALFNQIIKWELQNPPYIILNHV